MLVTVYYFDKKIKNVIFDHKDWNKKCPDNILKIFVEFQPDKFQEISGYALYFMIIKDGVAIFGGFNQTMGFTPSTNIQSKIDVTEIVSKVPKHTKYGIEVSNEIWNEMCRVTP